MRTITTVVATACLLLASPSPALSQSAQQPPATEFGAFQALAAGEERTLTSTGNLRVELFCEVLDPPVSLVHVVLAHIEIIGPNTGRGGARLDEGGIGWGRFDLELPGEVIYRFVANAEAPFLPDRAIVPAIRVQTSSREFVQMAPITVALEVFPNYPCVYRFAVRQRGTQ